MTIIVKGRFSSWNKIYAINSWIARKIVVDGIHSSVRFALIEQKIPKNYFKNRVTVTVRQYFHNKPYDSDNIPAKMYIDPLKQWLFVDDSIAYIGEVRTESFVDKTSDERVEITIEEIKT